MLRICRRQSGQRRREGGKRLKQGESGENILSQIFSTFSCGKEFIEKAGIGRKWEVQIAYNVYDEDDECYYCEADLDEDDAARLMERQYRACPLYRNGDEYAVVRKQI